MMRHRISQTNLHPSMIPMKTLNSKLIRTGFLALLLPFCAPAQTGAETNASPASAADKLDPGNLRTFVELARADIKTQKALVMAQNLPLTDDEAVDFWPLHHDYEAELSKLNDQKLILIKRYAENYKSMTDKQATELAKASFDLEAKKTDLKRKYFDKFSKVIPATKSARFFQIENQLNMVLDLQVAASLPLIK
jgi:hypothetical protein